MTVTGIHLTERRLSRALKTDFGGDMSGYRYRVHYSYDTWGHLTQVHETDAAGPLLWQATATDATGQITQQQAGNGLVTTRTYDPYTQRLKTIQTGSGASIQDLSYDWDANGNLTERQDHNQNLVEIFTYDDLNRLQGSTLNSLTNLALTYDAAGNIKTKSGVGSYAYAGSRPHAVTSIALYAGGNITFSYDANGNLLSGDGKTTQWTSYRYPKQISNSANNSDTSFAYGPDRQRYSETILRNGITAEQRHIIGSLYERETKDGIITHKHHILAGNQVIAIHDRRDDHSTDTRYLHRDHLGSVDTITDEAGGVITRMSFDAFGQRRDATDWDGEESSSNTENNRDITTRGYTGHPMLDDAGYIHMGGRVYDPALGRFLSPDPNIPDPSNSQAFNRYAYVYNNPLSYTDPSGFLPNETMRHPGGVWHLPSPATPAASPVFDPPCHSVEECKKQREEERKKPTEVTKEVEKTAEDAATQTQTGDASGEAQNGGADTNEKSSDSENGDANGGVAESGDTPVWPTDNDDKDDVTSGYLPNRTDPVTGESSRPHTAIDIRNPVGSPVYSVQDGVVEEVGHSNEAGNYLKVNHADGVQTSYSHTGTELLEGAQVTRGQVIGHSDGSGRINGPHLHFVVRRNGERVNPCTVVNCP